MAISIKQLKTRQQEVLSEIKAIDPDVDEAALRLDPGAYAKCRAAGSLMVRAMESQDRFRSGCLGTEARLNAGLKVSEKDGAAYERMKAAAVASVTKYADAHLDAHRMQYAAEARLYKAADGAMLTKLNDFTYDRDPVDKAIASFAAARWNAKHPAPPGKNGLLVGSSISSESLAQLVESNTHTPLPLEGTVSGRCKIAYGELSYAALGSKLENNDLRQAAKTNAVEKKAAPEVAAVQPKQPAPRVYDDSAEKNPNRKRTFVVSEILFKEKAAKGVRLSPDPAASREKGKAMSRDQA